jgi:prepilin-type N-terminal cleavage/methylation domain-containing protein
MRGCQSEKHGFTLIELILVMLIIAIMSAMLAPSFTKFGRGQETKDFALRITGLARYARTQAICEGRTYRLNFDDRDVWLTEDGGDGTFDAPANDWGQRFTAPDGVSMQTTVTAQANMQVNLPASVQQQTIPQPNGGLLLNGQQGGVAGLLVQNVRVPSDGTYMEFSPTGRTDPATIVLTDQQRQRIELTVDSPTDALRVVPGGGS